jgi:hypothetical protein
MYILLDESLYNFGRWCGVKYHRPGLKNRLMCTNVTV